MHIKKGDNVIVVSGSDRGKNGKVLRVFPKKDLVLVEGVNIKKRHQRPRRENQKGQIIDKTLPVHVSNIMLADPDSKKPTRIHTKTEKGEKTRVAARSGSAIA